MPHDVFLLHGAFFTAIRMGFSWYGLMPLKFSHAPLHLPRLTAAEA